MSSSDNTIVQLEYYGATTIPINSVEWNNQIYKCSNCPVAGLLSSDCCEGPCAKCKYQYPYYVECSGGLPVNCQPPRDNEKTNGRLSSTIIKITNGYQIDILCNPATRLKCCLGDISLSNEACSFTNSEGLVESYWGPTNLQGNCDADITRFCGTSSNPVVQNMNNKACICVLSPITQSVCADNRCNPNGLILLSNQLANKNACSGTYVQCTTYLNFPPDIQNHVIKSFLVDQACGVNVVDDGKNASNYPDQPNQPNPTEIVPEGSNNLGFILIIVGTCIGVVLFFVAIYFIVTVSLRKKRIAKKHKK